MKNQVKNIESANVVTNINESAAQTAKEVNESTKEAKASYRVLLSDLEKICYLMNEEAKQKDSKIRAFFAAVGLSIKPRDSRKVDSERVYLTPSLIVDAYKRLKLFDAEKGICLRLKKDKNTGVNILVPETFSGSRVFDVLAKDYKAVLRQVKEEASAKKQKALNKANRAKAKAAKAAKSEAENVAKAA